jgi:PmbA protein
MPGAIGQEGFREVAHSALEISGVDGVEVLFVHEWGGLTRFANSHIHQSTASEDTSLHVRIVAGGRVGVSETNDFSANGARRAAASAKEMAEVSSPDPFWPGLAPSARIAEVDRYADDTASATPDLRAEAVAGLVGQVPPGFVAAGAFETRASEVGIANTQGQLAWSPSTQATISTVVTGGEGGSGFAEALAPSVAEIDPRAVGVGASTKALGSERPRPLDPGIYPVVLEPAATGTLTSFLGWTGFGGKDFIEGRSCLSGKQGKQVAEASISIWDDGTDPRTIGVPFDFEGEPKRRVDLIRQGVFLDAVFDRRTAKRAGREAGSTGHALPAPNPEGPFPLHLFMEEGNASIDDMVAATDRGLLVTRFHYTNVVNPIESSITGMTRDGTFLIERGKIVGPVMNLRFTQSILEALSNVSMVGTPAALQSEFFFSASRVPPLKIDAFHFSGRSDH